MRACASPALLPSRSIRRCSCRTGRQAGGCGRAQCFLAVTAHSGGTQRLLLCLRTRRVNVLQGRQHGYCHVRCCCCCPLTCTGGEAVTTTTMDTILCTCVSTSSGMSNT
jgi:hypothetical protein